MGKIRLEFRANARTGKRRVIVYYESDPSLTYQEHIRRHREIVDMLLSLNIIKKESPEEIVIQTLEGEVVYPLKEEQLPEEQKQEQIQ